MNISKLENPARLQELDPKGTLEKIGLKNGDVICDIGAGSGIFTIPAAKITKGDVYALDISGDMLNIIAEKAQKEGLTNVKSVLVDSGDYKIEDGAVDHVLMVTAFHHIDETDFLFNQIKRVLKPSGTVTIIEFHKKETPMGPPVDHRIDEQEVKNIFINRGYKVKDQFNLGDNFYTISFTF